MKEIWVVKFRLERYKRTFNFPNHACRGSWLNPISFQPYIIRVLKFSSKTFPQIMFYNLFFGNFSPRCSNHAMQFLIKLSQRWSSRQFSKSHIYSLICVYYRNLTNNGGGVDLRFMVLPYFGFAPRKIKNRVFQLYAYKYQLLVLQ